MKLPEIDIDQIPGLATKTGIYGSTGMSGGGRNDDRVVAVMVFIYNSSGG